MVANICAIIWLRIIFFMKAFIGSAIELRHFVRKSLSLPLMKNSLYSNDTAFELDLKSHDESRQGEVLVIDAPESFISNGKSYYIESYGCQMNFNDSEIVASVLASKGYKNIQSHETADVILLNTCSIRDKAEQTIRARLAQLNKIKKTNPGTVVGILGCMAERLKEQLLVQEHLVDIVAGPDAYRSLPDLIEEATGGQKEKRPMEISIQ